MNIQQTIDVAALLAAHAPHVIEQPSLLPEAPLGEYWQHSRQRLSAWLQTLEECKNWRANPEQEQTGWTAYRALAEEIFMADVLSRVWGAVLTASDRYRGATFAEPLARNVMLGQMQARQLVLRSMVEAGSEAAEQIVLIDQTRRRAERWSDVLLGHLVLQYDVDEYAFDPDRARDFGQEQAGHDVRDSNRPVWELIFAGLRIAFSATTQRGLRDCHHRELVGAILRTFPIEAFEQNGPLKSMAHLRIERSSTLPEASWPDAVRRPGAPSDYSQRPPTGLIRRTPSRPGEPSADESPGVSFAKAFRNRRHQS